MDLIRVILFFSTVSITLSKPTKSSTDVNIKKNIKSLGNEQSISFNQNGAKTKVTSTETALTGTPVTTTPCGEICQLHKTLRELFGETK